MNWVRSYLKLNIFSEKDIIMQLARCTFDAHLEEILGALCLGASLVMLSPHGTLDLSYLIEMMRRKQVSYITPVPTLLNQLCDYLSSEKIASIVPAFNVVCGGQSLFYYEYLWNIFRFILT